jgi:hypothetical protein
VRGGKKIQLPASAPMMAFFSSRDQLPASCLSHDSPKHSHYRVCNSGTPFRNLNTCCFVWGPNTRCIMGRRQAFGGIGGRSRGPCALDSPHSSLSRPIKMPRWSRLAGERVVIFYSDVRWAWGENQVGQSDQRGHSAPTSQLEDGIVWTLEPSGRFSIRSLYLQLYQGTASKHFSGLWWIPVPMKMRIFLWQLARKRLPSNENIWRRRPPMWGYVPFARRWRIITTSSSPAPCQISVKCS